MFETLQNEVYEWSEKQFPGQSSINPGLGQIEEFGELTEVIINSDGEKEEEIDAVGDIIVYSADFAARRGLDLQKAAETDISSEDYQNIPEETFEIKNAFEGIIIAIGRITRSVLKQEQGIREDEDRVGSEAEQYGLALLIDRIDAYCSTKDYTLQECVENAWDEEVSDREWDSSYKNN